MPSPHHSFFLSRKNVRSAQPALPRCTPDSSDFLDVPRSLLCLPLQLAIRSIGLYAQIECALNLRSSSVQPLWYLTFATVAGHQLRGQPA